MYSFKKQFCLLAVILGTTLTVVFTFSSIVKLLKIEAFFSETGLHSNLARAYKVYDNTTFTTAIIGSSISGRILGEYFSPEFQVCANLGMDAGGTSTGVQVFLNGIAKTEIAVVETNTFFKAPEKWGQVTIDKIHTPTFKIKQELSLIQETSRPSSVIYTLIKRINDKTGGAPLKAINNERAAVDRFYIRTLIQKLLARSNHVVFVNYPSKLQCNPTVVDFFQNLATSDPRIYYIDLQAIMKDSKLLYSDQIHLTLPSARKVVSELEQQLHHLKIK